MRNISSFISPSNQTKPNGAGVIACAALLAAVAIGVPAAAIWMASNVSGPAPAPTIEFMAEAE